MESNEHHSAGKQGLSSAEYRTRLLTKLNCLIAVLEVAIAKIARSMETPGANEQRLLKVRANLENTLSICSRAKQTLESGPTKSSRPGASRPALPGPARSSSDQRMTYRDYVELSSIEEYNKFKSLPPIEREDISGTDIDGLISQLFES